MLDQVVNHTIFRHFFEKVAKKSIDKKENLSSGQVAAIGAVGVAGGKSVLDSARNALKDVAEEKNKTNSYSKLLKSLKPGDILYTGYNPHLSGNINAPVIGKGGILPLKTSQLVQMGTGNKNYHGMIYLGNGLIAQAEGENQPLAVRKLKNEISGQRLKAYRPKGATKAEIDSAVNYAKKMVGTRYKTPTEFLSQGARMLLDPTGGPKTCRKGKNGIVCNTLVTKAYNKRFPKEYMSINEVRNSGQVQHIKTYDRLKKSPVSDRVINRVLFPLAKNLKWALPGAALGYLANSLRAKKEPSS